MNFPSLPTDNLYKFITLAGVLLIVFSLWLLRDNSIRMDEGVSQYNAVMGQVDVTQTKLEDRLLELNVTLTSLENAVKQAQTPEDARANGEAITRFKADYQNIWSLKSDVLKAQVDAKNKDEELARLLDRIGDDLSWSKWGYILGCIMVLGGSQAWYMRHQRYQDGLLRAQLLALQSEARSLSSNMPSPLEGDQTPAA